MHLDQLKAIFNEHGCQKIYVKQLSANDNSKNQVYLGGSFDILNIFPLSDIHTESPGNWERERFKATIKFAWIDEDSRIYPAPNAQLILYPKYPEVRFSGFLTKCEKPPSELMNKRLPDRILFLSVSRDGIIIGYVSDPSSQISRDFLSLCSLPELGVFKIIELSDVRKDKIELINELKRINRLGWINSKRLDKTGNIIDCIAPQCVGYTLEAELGIIPNGYSAPDFRGWEVKAMAAKNIEKANPAIITLMTPEPTGGLYKDQGVKEFLLKYGYADRSGKPDRLNYGGVHKVGETTKLTNVKMELVGFDLETGKIKNADGKVILLDNKDFEIASWNFSTLLLHWNTKHNQACYVPSQTLKEVPKKYRYGHNILFGEGTDFQLFLKQMAAGNIYYDPGIKMEDVSGLQKTKKRSQFRINSKFLNNLYYKFNSVDIYEWNP